MPLLDAGRLPLAPPLKYGPYRQLLDKLIGALLVLPLYASQSQITMSECPLYRFCIRDIGRAKSEQNAYILSPGLKRGSLNHIIATLTHRYSPIKR